MQNENYETVVSSICLKHFLCVGENIFFYFVKFYIYILIIIFNHTSSSDLKNKTKNVLHKDLFLAENSL